MLFFYNFIVPKDHGFTSYKLSTCSIFLITLRMINFVIQRICLERHIPTFSKITFCLIYRYTFIYKFEKKNMLKYYGV